MSLTSSNIDAPHVTVLAHNTTTAARSMPLRCLASGQPTTYTYISWEQRWPGHPSVVRTYAGSENLTLVGLTYEHSGYYTCMVSNGVQFSRNPDAGVGSTSIEVKGIRLIFHNLHIYPYTVYGMYYKVVK